MLIGIVGGRLQGMEAVYLAKKAGFETLVIDRKEDAPATSIQDAQAQTDASRNTPELKNILEECDAVIPACEDIGVMENLANILKDSSVKFLFDPDAYRISNSKIESNAVMRKAGVPLPGEWPECGFPAVVKPSSYSGSMGVSVAFNDDDLKHGLDIVKDLGDEPVIQEFVHGKSVSIEVIGDGRGWYSYVTTEVVLDGRYDCKMVRCNPNILSATDEMQLGKIGTDVAENIGLSQLMDVEAILSPKGLRVLEIDARIPSQTPAAVEAATGINLLEELVLSADGGLRLPRKTKNLCSVYRHLFFRDGTLSTCGEKTFARVTSPNLIDDFFGQDAAITDYFQGSPEWYATLIHTGYTEEEADAKADACVKAIMEACGTDKFVDSTPDVI